MAAAEHFVLDHARSGGLGVADHHLFALDDHHAVDDARVVGGAAPAPAQGLDLEHLDLVGELDQPARAGEELSAKVAGDPEGEDIDVHLIDQPGELLDLGGGVELGLVTDHVVDAVPAGAAFDDDIPEVQAVADLDGRRREP